jgi:hypothetical protein
MHVEGAHLCRVPNAFRTDFRPRTRQEDAGVGVRHRSIQAEGRALDLDRVTVPGFGANAGMQICFDQSSSTFRLNRGPSMDTGRAFVVERGEQQLGRLWTIPGQAIASDLRAAVMGFQPAAPPETLWLAAPKTTDALYLLPLSQGDGLALHRLPARSERPSAEEERWLGVRAAAVSATYLLVNRASLDLDVDPEEFDVLEPRSYGRGAQLPLLQVTDHLVNGAGFCRELHRPGSSGAPVVGEMIRSMIQDHDQYPRRKFETGEHGSCDSACYVCLLRYGNQPLHGLLDWQLGLTFLRAFVDPSFRCGLDGNFDAPGLTAWPALAKRLATEMAERFDGTTREFGTVPAFRVSIGRERTSPWTLVAHPLWDFDVRDGPPPDSILARAFSEASGDGCAAMCVDTFNLSRRQVRVREAIRSQCP